MLKREIKYTDFDGNKASDTFYFNITKSEIVELEVERDGGMEGYIKRIINAEDNHALVAEFKKIILLAYGQKSPDGKRFIKTDQLREEFSQTAAFDELFIELATKDGAAADFFIGVLPADVSQAAQAQELLPQPNIQPAENLRPLPQPNPETQVIQ